MESRPTDETLAEPARNGGAVWVRSAAAKRAAPGGFALVFGAHEFPLTATETVVGRGGDAGIVIDSQAISRRHAKITVDDDRVILEDLGSKNGTFVDGIRLDKPIPISDGVHFRLGPVWVSLRCRAATP